MKEPRLTQRAVAGREAIAAAFATVRAPWGLIHVAVSERGVVAVSPWDDTATFAATLARRVGGRVVPEGPEVPETWRQLLARTKQELAEYVAGARRSFDLPLDLLGLSAWERRVLEGTATVEFGGVITYGQLAARVRAPRAARAVGNAMARNPLALLIPCHRVVAADGTVGGYGGSNPAARESARQIKRMLLRLEGVDLPAGPTSRTRPLRSGPAAAR
jgi:methylated-DNA-[protein]-cysteine S-methyltransferase